MKTLTSNENDTNSKESTQELTNDEDLLHLFKQYSEFAQPTSDWLGPVTTTVISEASMQGKGATYHIIVQEQPTIAQFDTGA